MKIFIGYDSKQAEASEVCEYSIRKHWKDAKITHLKTDELRRQGLYWRNAGDPHSTEFTYTRFLVPYLSNYHGRSLFVDSDFIFTEDLRLLESQLNCNYSTYANKCPAVWCVQHEEYVPKANTKFYGKPQLTFPRKNWSSLMVFNNEHQLTRTLTPNTVNTATPQYLHRLNWALKSVGKIHPQWNFLCGEHEHTHILPPCGIHFTNGGPFNDVHGQDFEDLWYCYRAEMNKGELF